MTQRVGDQCTGRISGATLNTSAMAFNFTRPGVTVLPQLAAQMAPSLAGTSTVTVQPAQLPQLPGPMPQTVSGPPTCCGSANAVWAGSALVAFRIGLAATILAFPLATAAAAGAYWVTWEAGSQIYVMNLDVVRHCDSFAGTAFCDSFFAGDTEVAISSLQNGDQVAAVTGLIRSVYALLACISIGLVLLQLIAPACRGSACAAPLPVGGDPHGMATACIIAGIPAAAGVAGIMMIRRFANAAQTWADQSLEAVTPGAFAFGLASGFRCAAAASAFALIGAAIVYCAVAGAYMRKQRLLKAGVTLQPQTINAGRFMLAGGTVVPLPQVAVAVLPAPWKPAQAVAGQAPTPGPLAQVWMQQPAVPGMTSGEWARAGAPVSAAPAGGMSDSCAATAGGPGVVQSQTDSGYPPAITGHCATGTGTASPAYYGGAAGASPQQLAAAYQPIDPFSLGFSYASYPAVAAAGAAPMAMVSATPQERHAAQADASTSGWASSATATRPRATWTGGTAPAVLLAPPYRSEPSAATAANIAAPLPVAPLPLVDCDNLKWHRKAHGRCGSLSCDPDAEDPT